MVIEAKPFFFQRKSLKINPCQDSNPDLHVPKAMLGQNLKNKSIL